MAERFQNTDTRFMSMALREARKGLGRTSPNPAVGAVIVKNGKAIAKGFHRKAGLPHAEIEALTHVEGQASGCTLYVTLEPCHHYGRTPPCTDAILKSGITRVVMGMKDPNPSVAGGGAEFLKKNGVDITMGILESECHFLNEAYLKHIRTNRPFVIAKSAITLDGWTGTATGHSQWVTNEKSRQFVHRLRDQVDAVMVGVGTVLSDDPRLTTRITTRGGRDPIRIVVDTHMKTPAHAKVVDHHSVADTFIIVGEKVSEEYITGFSKKGVFVIPCPTRNNRIDLSVMLGLLSEKSVTSILLEGGATLMGTMVRERLIDKYHIFIAPKLLGGGDGLPMAAGKGPERMDQCLELTNTRMRRFEGDTLITGYPK